MRPQAVKDQGSLPTEKARAPPSRAAWQRHCGVHACVLRGTVRARSQRPDGVPEVQRRGRRRARPMPHGGARTVGQWDVRAEASWGGGAR